MWQLIDPTSLLKLVLALEYGIAFPDLLMPDGKENPFGGLTAHILHAGGPWKLGSGLGQNPEANTALGVGRGCARLRALFESLGLDGLRSPPSLYPHPLSPPKSPCSTTPSSPGQDLEKVPSEEETETGGRVTST